MQAVSHHPGRCPQQTDLSVGRRKRNLDGPGGGRDQALLSFAGSGTMGMMCPFPSLEVFYLAGKSSSPGLTDPSRSDPMEGGIPKLKMRDTFVLVPLRFTLVRGEESPSPKTLDSQDTVF